MNELSVARFVPPDQQNTPLADSRAGAVAELTRHVRDGAVLTLLAGPAGVGKSVVLNEALAALTGDATRVIRLSNPSGSTWSQQEVTDQLLRGAPAPAGQAVAELTSARDGSPAVIAVDDAHTMTDDAFEMLLAITAPAPDGRLPPQLLLAGRGAFWERPSRGELQLFDARRVTLEPLAGADATAYVALCLRRAGGLVNDVSPGAMSAVLRYSGGLPGRINQILAAAVSIGIVRGGGVLSRPIVKAAIAALGPEFGEPRDEVLAAASAGEQPAGTTETSETAAPDFDARAVVVAPILSAWSSAACTGGAPAPAACAIVVPDGQRRASQVLAAPEVQSPALADDAERQPLAPAGRTLVPAHDAEIAAPSAVSPVTRSRQAAARESSEGRVPAADPLEVTPFAVSPGQAEPPSPGGGVAVWPEDSRPSRKPNWEPYLRGSHGMAVAALTRGIRDHETLLFLTGPAGVGKSTVLSAALAELADGPFRVIRLSNPGTPSWSETDVLRQILGRRARSVTENWPAQAAIADLWETSHDEAPVVVSVDDAHTLTDEAIELLLLTVLPPRRRGLPLQLVLSGQGEFWDRQWQGRLQSIKHLAERVILRPLFGSEASDYIAFRLSGRDGSIDDLVSLEAVFAIMRYSGGLPAHLDQLLSVLIAARAGQEDQILTGDMVKTAVDSMEGRFASPAAIPDLTPPTVTNHRPDSLTPETVRGATTRIASAGDAEPVVAFALTASETSTGTGLLVQRRRRIAAAAPPGLAVGHDASAPASGPPVRATPEPDRPGDAPPPFFEPQTKGDRSALLLADGAATAADASSLWRQSPASADRAISFASRATAVARPDLAILAGARGWWAGGAAAATLVVSLSLLAMFPGQRVHIEDTISWTWLNALRDPAPTPPNPMPARRPVLGAGSAQSAPAAEDKPVNAVAVTPAPDVSDADHRTSENAGRSTESPLAAAEGSPAAVNPATLAVLSAGETATSGSSPDSAAIPPNGTIVVIGTNGSTSLDGSTATDGGIATTETMSSPEKSPASEGTNPAQAAVDIARGLSSEAETTDPRPSTTEGTPSPVTPATAVIAAEVPIATPSVATPPVVAVPGTDQASDDPIAPHPGASPPSASTSSSVLAGAGAASTGPAVDLGPLSEGGKVAARPTQEALPVAATVGSPATADPASVVTASSAIAIPGRDRPLEGPNGAAQPSNVVAAPVPPPSNAVAAPVPPPSEVRLTQAAVASLLRRGDAMLSQGDVLSARLLFERAAAAGSGAGAIGAGKTYDPVFLATIDAPGLKSDVARAVAWYRSAAATPGDREADARLKALTAQTGQ